MKKVLKMTAGAAGVLVLLIIGLSIFVKSYLSDDRLNPIILPKAEAMTGRKVQIDEIKVSLFKGVVAKGLSVKEKDGKEDFLKIGRVVLTYHLLPLLRREFVIGKIEIISPLISIGKDRGGRYNFSDILEKHIQEQQKSPIESGSEHPFRHQGAAPRIFMYWLNSSFVRNPVSQPRGGVGTGALSLSCL